MSTCSRRQLARRRSGRMRRGIYAIATPVLLTASVLLAGMAAFIAGRGGL